MVAKIIRGVIIGIVLGFAVDFGVAALLKANGTPDPNLALYCGVVAGLISAYLLANLSGNRAIASASEDVKQHALAQLPPAGKALLYVYREGFVAKLAGLNIAIDGRAVAQLKSPRFTCIAIAAGTHTLSAGFGGFAGPQNKTGTLSFDAPADGIIVVKITVEIGVVQNSAQFTQQTDISAAKLTLASMAMTPPDVLEI